jgi:hypothetical protein
MLNSKPLKACHDKLIFLEDKIVQNSKIEVYDEHGIEIIYHEALNDLVLLEEELIKIGSYYLNKAEFDKHLSSNDQPSSMLDRPQVALHLLENEL